MTIAKTSMMAGVALISATIWPGDQVAAAPLQGPVTQEEPADRPDLEDPATQAMMREMMGEFFPVEPLTAEQEARLPATQLAANAVLPDGTLLRTMNMMGEGFLGDIMTMGLSEEVATGSLLDSLGIYEEELDSVTEADRSKLLAMIDPQADARAKLQSDALMAAMADVMAQFEPALRDGLARAYARRFTDQQLADVNAFFATPSGSFYASESWVASSDPQVMAAMTEAMPAMMGAFFAMAETMEAADAELPAVRTYSDLSASERARAAELLGISAKELSQRAAAAN